MSQAAAIVADQQAAVGTSYAGFWRRLFALFIDWVLVSSLVLTLFLALAAAIPGLSKVVALKAPLGLFTTERTLESKTTESREDGRTVSVTESIIERTVLGQWTYFYRDTKTETIRSASTRNTTTTWTTIKSQQIDPVTRQDIKTTDLDDIVMIVLVIYWILMEASPLRASFGKLTLGLVVVDQHGQRLSIPRAAGRNLLKFVSVITLFIGFMLAGWTVRRQSFWDSERDKLREALARLVGDVRRLACDAASGVGR